MELKYNWSASMFRVAVGVFATLAGLWFFSQAVSSGDVANAIIPGFWVFLLGGLSVREAYRAQTGRLWALLDPKGVTDYDGQFYAWDEFDEIRYRFGALCFGEANNLTPRIALPERVLGEEQLKDAERYIRSNAPGHLLEKL
ncbi:MAG: hypothetical protein AAFP81_12630 [Pseudomonadota bacterium]